MTRRGLLAGGVAVAAVAVLGPRLGRALDPIARERARRVRPRAPFAMPSFSFRDERGAPVSRDALLGRPWVASFLFLGCGRTTPGLSARMVSLLARVRAPEVRLVSFSVDDNDGPEALAAHLAAWRPAGDLRWSLVRGPRAELARLAVALRMVDDEADVPDGFLRDGQSVFLVDREGVVRGVYDGLDDGDGRRLGDALAALVEAR